MKKETANKQRTGKKTAKRPAAIKWLGIIMALCLSAGTMPIKASAKAASVYEWKIGETSQKAAKKQKADKELLNSLDKVIKSQKIDESSTEQEALKTLFAYVQKKCNYSRTMNFTAAKGWEYTYAKQMLKKKKGSCYHYAAAYAFLAKRATGLPVRICIGTSNAFNKKVWQKHGWVEIKRKGKWYTYDPNAARYSKLRKGKWYQQPLSSMKKKVYKTTKTVNVNIEKKLAASKTKASKQSILSQNALARNLEAKNPTTKNTAVQNTWTKKTAAPNTSVASASKKSGKQGLKKENGKYYYYESGKRIKNKWKTIKTNNKKGKSISFRYYFGKDGAAYAGKKADGIKVPSVRKISGKTYGFDLYGRMVKGIYVIGEKFYVFHSKTGVYDGAKSQKLRKASAYEKNAAALRKLLGKPQKTEKASSCYGFGKDLTLYYPNFIVVLFQDKKGKEVVLEVSGR